MSTTNIKAITDITSSDIDRLNVTLNTRGILFEKEYPFLSASIIEYQYEELELLLRENGYNGGRLIPIFAGNDKSSLTYALFDSDEIGAEVAMKMVRDMLKNSN